jgi:nitrosocyanin
VKRYYHRYVSLVIALVFVAALSACNPAQQNAQVVPGAEEAALKTYVPGGQLDEYYMFSSGGHSGQVFVYGIPSMRRIRTLNAFTSDPATGYGYSSESREMMQGLTWGDTHHPALSETNGDYDGRWLFINDNANSRIARFNLQTFQVEQIIGPVPNLAGLHSGPFVTPNSEYVFGAIRFPLPLPRGSYAPLEEFKDKFFGPVAGFKVNQDSGEMTLAWQILLPPINLDLADSGKNVSDGWVFFSSYNAEMAYENLEVNASQNDRDFLVALNWKAAEQAAGENKGEQMDGVQILDPRKVPGLAYLTPIYKKDESRPNSIWTPDQARIERDGSNVTVHMIAVRSHFTPEKLEVNQGDKVTIYVTNIDQTNDVSHGLGIDAYDVNVQIDPGETKTVEFTADKAGVYAMYCTNFCSALHQEMQGYLLVKPAQ